MSQHTELRVEQGTQVLLSASSMDRPIRRLAAIAEGPLLVVSSKSPSEVAAELSAGGADLSTAAHIPISGAEVNYDGPMWVCDPIVPDDLTGLSMRLSRAFASLADGDACLVVENLNVFLMYAAEDRVFRFFDHVTTNARDHGITGVYTLVADAVAEDTTARLRASVDTELDD